MVVKSCIICKREFECYDKPQTAGKGFRHKLKRRHNAITCSPKCAKEYGLVCKKRYKAKIKNEQSKT